MRIYLDNCCYNRLFDEKTQERVREESDAIKKLLIAKQNIIIGGNILRSEIANIRDIDKKLSVMALYTQAVTETVAVDEQVINRAKEIMQQANVKQMDALHLSCAISSSADVFLTVDDKLIKASQKLNLNMRVINPIYLGECFLWLKSI